MVNYELLVFLKSDYYPNLSFSIASCPKKGDKGDTSLHLPKKGHLSAGILHLSTSLQCLDQKLNTLTLFPICPSVSCMGNEAVFAASAEGPSELAKGGWRDIHHITTFILPSSS